MFFAYAAKAVRGSKSSDRASTTAMTMASIRIPVLRFKEKAPPIKNQTTLLDSVYIRRVENYVEIVHKSIAFRLFRQVAAKLCPGAACTFLPAWGVVHQAMKPL